MGRQKKFEEATGWFDELIKQPTDAQRTGDVVHMPLQSYMLLWAAIMNFNDQVMYHQTTPDYDSGYASGEESAKIHYQRSLGMAESEVSTLKRQVAALEIELLSVRADLEKAENEVTKFRFPPTKITS